MTILKEIAYFLLIFGEGIVLLLGARDPAPSLFGSVFESVPTVS